MYFALVTRKASLVIWIFIGSLQSSAFAIIITFLEFYYIVQGGPGVVFLSLKCHKSEADIVFHII